MSGYINLYREGGRAQAAGRHGLMLLSAAGLLLLLGMGGGLWLHLQARALEQRVAAEEAKLKAAQARMADAARRMGSPGAAARIADLEKRIKEREALLAALDAGALGDMNGYTEYLRALGRQSGKGVWITSFEVAHGGGFLALSGKSVDGERLPAYLAALNGESAFHGRKIGALNVAKAEEGKPEAGGGTRTPRGAGWVSFTLGTAEPQLAENTGGGATDLVGMVASGKPLPGSQSAAGAPHAAGGVANAEQSTAAALGALAGAQNGGAGK